MICGSGGRKVGSLKRRVRSHLPKWEMKNCTPLSREAHFQVKMYKPHQVRTTFFELSCRKNARRCGTKHVSKSKCTKHNRFGPLFQVELSKKCTPLWHEARFQVKMYKAPHVRTTFGRSDVVSCGKRRGLCTLSIVSKNVRVFVAVSIATTNALHYTTLHYTTPHYTTLHYTTLHYATLNNTALHYTTLHSITLHHTTLRQTTLHYTTLHYTLLRYTTPNDTQLHYS